MRRTVPYAEGYNLTREAPGDKTRATRIARNPRPGRARGRGSRLGRSSDAMPRNDAHRITGNASLRELRAPAEEAGRLEIAATKT